MRNDNRARRVPYSQEGIVCISTAWRVVVLPQKSDQHNENADGKQEANRERPAAGERPTEQAPAPELSDRAWSAPDPSHKNADEQCANREGEVAPYEIHHRKKVGLPKEAALAEDVRHVAQRINSSLRQRRRKAEQEGDR